MLERIQIKHFRGIEHLDVGGLGRFNLVIGPNGSGKTTFLAAAAFSVNASGWPFHCSRFLDDPRLDSRLDFQRHLVPICPGGDLDLTPEVRWGKAGEAGAKLLLRQEPGKATATVVDIQTGDILASAEQTGDTWKFIGQRPESHEYWWAPAFVESERQMAVHLIDAYKAGRMQDVVSAVRRVNPRVKAVELAGNDIYVRLEGHLLPLRYGVLGDGARRILEFALGIASGCEEIFIDEIENGFHYSTLPSVITMLLGAGSVRQIFATTHREEVIQIACETFERNKDDGLRVIRIDRDGDAHRAVVYTAAEALAGLESGLELRG